MIIETVGFSMALIGTYSTSRWVHQKMKRWQEPYKSKGAKQQQASCDSMPSSTVELVRTVLEHQAKREDQSRHELVFLLTKMRPDHPLPDPYSIPILETEKTANTKKIPEPNTGWSPVPKFIQRWLPQRIR